MELLNSDDAWQHRFDKFIEDTFQNRFVGEFVLLLNLL
jgi:hypothetical protein